MSKKNKQKQNTIHVKRILKPDEFSIMDFLEKGLSGIIWCTCCNHVYHSDDWFNNDFKCPLSKCESHELDENERIIIPWSLIKADPKNKNDNNRTPEIPEIGHAYHPHIRKEE